jgi:hypothetical protein
MINTSTGGFTSLEDQYGSVGTHAGSLWGLLCPDLQDRIVREVASSASLVRLYCLARTYPLFQPAYTSRLTAQQNDLLQAGPQLPSPDMLCALLALLHRQMTRHPVMHQVPLLWLVAVCYHCAGLPCEHVQDRRWPWLLRCPPDALPPGPHPRCYNPMVPFLTIYILCVVIPFRGKLRLLDDGGLDEDDFMPYLPTFWWDGFKEEEELVPPPPWLRRLSTVGSIARTLLVPPLVIAISDNVSPGVFGETKLTVRVHGYGRGRTVMIKPNLLGPGALLGFVLTLGQGAEGMQQEAWLELKVCLDECNAENGRVPDMIVSLLPVCEQLVLGGPDGVRKLYVSPTHQEDQRFLFKSLTLTGLDCAALEALKGLPLHELPVTASKWVGLQFAKAKAALGGWWFKNTVEGAESLV